MCSVTWYDTVNEKMSLRDLDQQMGCLELLRLLLKEGTLWKRQIVSKLNRSPEVAYGALEVLNRLGLITEVEQNAFPYRKDVSLNDRGRRVAEHLLEIEKVLSQSE
jgi:DNA-binding PadR family transcriptional regulator